MSPKLNEKNIKVYFGFFPEWNMGPQRFQEVCTVVVKLVFLKGLNLFGGGVVASTCGVVANFSTQQPFKVFPVTLALAQFHIT